MNDLRLLDCTLRDGGYVNNWEFSLEDSKQIISALYDSGIRTIEIGLLANGEKGNGTKFVNFEEMIPLLEDKKEDCTYAAMATVNEISRLNVPERKSSTVDLIRVAFFKDDKEKAFNISYDLLEKGYQVFLQPMATFMYSDTELEGLISDVNNIKPNAVYMVDSFSNLYPADVRKMAEAFLSRLDKNINFGFHAHNNVQMAYANVLEFISIETDRTLYADGSIFGMGRGAGNLPIELIMQYLNKHGSNYDIVPVMKCFSNCLESVYKKYGWGYSHPYMLTAEKSMNSVYGWYLHRKGIYDIEKYNCILSEIPDEFRHTLNREITDQIIQKYSD